MNNDRNIYIFIGAPGSGKGTMAQKCVNELGWTKLSTGDLCRQHIAEQTDIGKQIDFIIKSGKLIPDTLVSSMVDEWLSQRIKQAKDIILDGYPRTEQQVRLLFEILRTKYDNVNIKIVKFDISDEAVVKRLSSRIVCQSKGCQAVYSTLPEAGLAPKKPMTCDRCGGPLMQRADDKPEVIRERLVVYHQHELSKIFSKMGYEIIVINSDRPFDVIFDDFKQLIRRVDA